MKAVSNDKSTGIGATFDDAWLLDGMRTPFVDYNGAQDSGSTGSTASRSMRRSARR